MSKTMQDMQEEVDDFISQFKVGYFSPLALMARMTEETGELAREINHYYGEKQKKETEDEKSLTEEMGDVLYVLITIANSLDIDLDESFDMVMKKFNSRDKNRFERIDED